MKWGIAAVVTMSAWTMASGAMAQTPNPLGEACAGKNNPTADQAIDACTQLLPRVTSPTNIALVYYERGFAYGRKGRYDLSIEDCDKAIESDPKLGVAYRQRGIARNLLRQHDRAIEDFTGALAINPNDVFSYQGRGGAYLSVGDFDHALADAEQDVRLEPNAAAAYLNRGVVLMAKNDYPRSLEDFDHAISLDPKNFVAYSDRCLSREVVNRLDDAPRRLRSGAQARPTSSCGVDLRQSGNRLSAAKELRRGHRGF